MSLRHRLCKHQYNCGDTDHSHRHLLCKRQYNCGAADPSHRHLLCRHQYNCGDTDPSHRHLFCRHQYNCGDTDPSHRHLLCRHQYNCGDTAQCDTVSGSLQTHSPLWRALRRYRRRLRTVATANAKLGEHSLTPRPPSETGTLATHSGKIWRWRAEVFWIRFLAPTCFSGGASTELSTKSLWWIGSTTGIAWQRPGSV